MMIDAVRLRRKIYGFSSVPAVFKVDGASHHPPSIAHPNVHLRWGVLEGAKVVESVHA